MPTISGFPCEKRHLGAFDIIGYTKIVRSGGEMYDETRADGRWAALQAMAAGDKRIYGIASHDKECPEDHYRYTVGIARDGDHADQLYSFHVKKSGWIVFSLDFERDYGKFWGSDPYKMTSALGCKFNKALGLHIDVYGSDYDGHAMEFWMPVR